MHMSLPHAHRCPPTGGPQLPQGAPFLPPQRGDGGVRKTCLFQKKISSRSFATAVAKELRGLRGRKGEVEGPGQRRLSLLCPVPRWAPPRGRCVHAACVHFRGRGK